MNNILSLRFKISMLVALMLVAVGGYFVIFRLPAAVERNLMSDFKTPQSVTPAANNRASTAGLESVEVMLLGLKQRLETQPGDVDGWVLLSKSYYHLNRWKEAEQTFEKAKALGYTGNWQPLPRIDAFSQNRPSSQNFDSTINFRDYKINENADQALFEGDGTVKQAELNISTDLKLEVSLNPDLKKQLSPGAAVFIFARAVENPGPPLAVVRKKVDELPFEIVLNDSHAMLPSRTISSVKNVILGARISVSGNPARQPGDYEQLSNSIPSNFSETVKLVINDKI